MERAYLRLAAAMLAAAPLCPARAAPPPPLPADAAGTWTLQDENAAITTARVTDRYYTNGIRLGYVSPADQLNPTLDDIARKLWGDGQRRWTLDITQQMFTPRDTRSRVPPTTDQPYAGLLLGSFGLVSDTTWHRSSLTASVGLVGPAALAGAVQNGFHDLIGQRGNPGWASQIPNEPTFQFTSARIYRIPLFHAGDLEADVLPELTAGAGTVRVYVETGATLRIGQGLDADFGAPRLRPGPTGGDVYRHDDGFAWYVFAGVDGQAVARDLMLDGTIFSGGPHVKREPFVGEMQGGLALIFHGVRLTYTHVMQSGEFRGQRGGLHQFGSFALSVRF